MVITGAESSRAAADKTVDEIMMSMIHALNPAIALAMNMQRGIEREKEIERSVQKQKYFNDLLKRYNIMKQGENIE